MKKIEYKNFCNLSFKIIILYLFLLSNLRSKLFIRENNKFDYYIQLLFDILTLFIKSLNNIFK